MKVYKLKGLIGPMSDAITNVGKGVVVTEEDKLNYNGPPRAPAPVKNNSPNATNDLWNPFSSVTGILGNKFFLFLMFIVGPFIIFKSLTGSGGMGY